MGSNITGCGYYEQVVPLAANMTKELTPVATDTDFIASNTRGATGIRTTNDAEVQHVFLHIVGIAVNTYTYANGLDCDTATDNQWQINLDDGAYSDLVNGVNADGQMLDNDWRCPLQGVIHPFHLMFDVTTQITNIDGMIGVRLQNGKSLQSSLFVTANFFLRVI